MAKRRSRPRFRRFKRRWDMQTFRECERQLNIDFDPNSTCAAPQTYADYLCGIGPSGGSTQMKPGASRSIVFGGAHLRYRLDAALVNNRDSPCSLSVKWVAAIVKLPLLEDELTPAYLPNLAISRSQLSVVPATQSDTDEDILWWRDGQMDLVNAACCGFDGTIACPSGFYADSGNCDPTCCDPSLNQSARVACNMLAEVLAVAGALYGRMEYDTVVRAKRRIREREALFLIHHWVSGTLGAIPNQPLWLVRRNAYLRYAVR